MGEMEIVYKPRRAGLRENPAGNNMYQVQAIGP